MAFGYEQYQRASNVVASPRELEAQAFVFVNRHLLEAADEIQRIHALHRNHKLWQLLVNDVASAENRLPEDLKRNILSLGFWAMKYSTQAIGLKLDIAPLIAVNEQIIEGLQAPLPAAAGPHEPGPKQVGTSQPGNNQPRVNALTA